MLSLNPTNTGENINDKSRKVEADALKTKRGFPPSDASMEPTNSQDAYRPRLAEDIFNSEAAPSPMPAVEQGVSDQPDAKALPSSALESLHQNGHGQSPVVMTIDESKAVNLAQTNGQANGQEPEPERGFFPVLKNRNFLTLWSGQVFSQLADKVYLVLMIALIASRFQSGDQSISGWVSSIMIAFTIPAVLFGSIAGVFVDRWSKKTVLVLTNLLRGGLVFALPPLLWLSKGWSPLAGLPVGFCVLLGITFFVSTLTQFFAPAEQSTLPLVVERRHLLSANSLYTTTMMASVIIGFAVGEPLLALADTLISQFGLTAIGLGKELVVASGYTIAGIILLLLKTGEKSRTVAAVNAEGVESTVETPHVWQDIRDGLRFLAEQGRVRSALIQLVILFSVFAALAVLSVRLAEVTPEIKSSQFGFLLAMGGVGMAIGATLIGQFGQRFQHAQLSLFGSLGMAASLVGISLSVTRLVPTLLLIAALGGFAAIVGVPMQTAIQEETPEAMRGKVFGLQNNAINIALSLPLALAGVAETFFGLRIVFLSLAVLVVAGGVLTWYISRTGLNQR
ncbi:arabinose efflux permease [Stenomitos frigidus ULC18]|uniref:Arabinose efflux permease n=2 Tax=Stenomitos TaxID=1844270 RepID=A0A2T1E618_9CYAN|nr:arabinose efflux permease [Stenomitos frigidus ULC18]